MNNPLSSAIPLEAIKVKDKAKLAAHFFIYCTTFY
ncbi:hypothetical protein HH_1728 [Helicobacter hepaticus ATCC 51449]|uniref:Uncharacterized protein n=1 Tax=Helicobacter hepaticus (strain ATCC 51449 / 3B1) TaxID=235279 RepID=Q7VFE8_HELHP|nr:hypothetical protein HH_1728 [Helicobacter hepaticus ATCC 51449]